MKIMTKISKFHTRLNDFGQTDTWISKTGEMIDCVTLVFFEFQENLAFDFSLENAENSAQNNS